jgi:hypothetical protein
VFENLFDRQCDIEAMRKLSPEEIEEEDRVWASAAFCVAKSNGKIRVVIDFRVLNTALKRREYHLPSIDEMFHEIYGFHLASVIDLNMGYLSIALTKETAKLLTVVTTFGVFECVVLPMGVKPATDIFQARMVYVFMSMPKDRPKPYIDDIFHGKGPSFDEHLEILAEIIRLLRLPGMQVNLDKSELCQKQVKFLGFLLTRTGFIPTCKRVDAILKLAPPRNVKQVRQLLSTINFIKNHIPNRAAIMQPITDLTKKEEKFEWGEEQQKAFDQTKAAVANAILCTYPNPNKRFILYPDTAQKYAMGGVLTQDYTGTELCCGTFSRKFTDAQLKYPVGEQELLAATESCDHFQLIIQGCKLLIRCDHKNITNAMTQHKNLCVLRQIVKLDQDYHAKFEHLTGELNTGGDGFSRLRMLDHVPRISINKCYDDVPSQVVDEIFAIDETNRSTNVDFPLAMSLIKSEQDKDERIQAIISRPELENKLTKFTFGNTEVHALEGKILVPASLPLRVIELGTKLLHFTLLYSYFTCLTPNFGRDVCRHVR